ncbi:hypothetical protein DRF59_12670 [Chryseobacterium flavum]|uniref:Uncharacterized protein n=1 Tax=Chryseobacterium flavum TaxID=415851 RepID=A0A3D9CKZ4_9FLAO|nr:hypothetical protein [Chryseobacterium flavum]REC66319.1 hypothetical protein DRF59_12670 [Chryseobacterium flavum]
MIINNLTRDNHLKYLNEIFKSAKKIFIISPFITKNINLINFGNFSHLEKITMVNAYNEMMQGFYKGEASENPNETMKKFAKFLLSIRKDVYNKDTKLKNWNMLRFMITDIEKVINNY